MAGKKQYYAWSNIRYDTADGIDHVKTGEKVTANGLNLTDEQFNELLESGAVRSMPFPDVPATWTGSPVEYLREMAKRAAEGVYTDAANSEEAALDAQMVIAAGSGQGAEGADDSTDADTDDGA